MKPGDDSTRPSEEPSLGTAESLDRVRAVVDEVSTRGPLARYEVGVGLGRGGVGEVVAARDRLLRREVAIKRLKSDRVPTTEQLRRFLLEAQVTAQLEHPNIVAVHDVGLDEQNHPWFTMVRVRGRSLHQLLKAGAAGSRIHRLNLFLKVCDALGYAHARGVIHRDLKPGNVMVGEHGQVVVLDWGLATRLGQDASSGRPVDADAFDAGQDDLTSDNEVLGTPMYMAPEQARGEPATHRSDLYALGVLLYTLLSGGQTPFARSEGLLAEVTAGRSIPLRARVPEVPPELEAIVSRAMRVDPMARYPTVAALKDDVEAFLDHREVAAHHYGTGQRLGRWVVRHRSRLIPWILSTAIGALVVFAISLLWVITTVVAAHRAQTAEHEARVGELEARVLLALAEADQGHAGGARVALREAREGLAALGASTQQAELAASWVERRHPRPLLQLATGTGTGTALAGDGASLVLASAEGLTWMSLPDGRVLGRRPGPGQQGRGQWVAGFVDGVPTAGWRAPAGRGETWRLFDLSREDAAPREVPAIGEGHLYDAALIRDGWFVQADGATGAVAFVDLREDRRRNPLRDVWLRATSPSGRTAVLVPAVGGREVTTADRELLVDLRSGAVGWQGPAVNAVPADDGRIAWVADRRLTVLDPSTKVSWTSPASDDDTAAFLPGGDVVLVDRHRLRRLSPDGVFLAEADVEGALSRTMGAFDLAADGTLLSHVDGTSVWTNAPSDPRAPLGSGALRAIELTPDGDLALAAGERLVLVDVGTGRVLRTFDGAPAVRDVVFAADPTVAWAVTGQALLRVDLVAGTVAEERTFDQVTAAVEVLADGSVAVALSDGRIVQVSPGVEAMHTWASGFEAVWDLERLDDGRLAVSDRRERAVAAILDPTTGASTPLPGDDRGPAYRLDHAGPLLVVSRHSGPVGVWRTDGEVPVKVCALDVGFEAVQAVAISPDGATVATGALDGQVVIWAVDGCERLLAVPMHDGPVTDLAFDASGERLVSVSEDGGMGGLDLHLARDLDHLVAPVSPAGWEGPPGARLLDLARAEVRRRNPEAAARLYARAVEAGQQVPPLELAAVEDDPAKASELVAAAADAGALSAWSARIRIAALDAR